MKQRLISAGCMLSIMGALALLPPLGQTLGLCLIGGVILGEWWFLAAPWRFLGSLYIIGGWSFFCMRAWYASSWIAYMALAWVIDTAAYSIGRWLRGPALAPRISPKKTLSGALGGGGAGLLWGYYILHIPLEYACLLSVVAQGGDLLESHIKRTLNIKDTGQWIPGHGGILDRCDSTVALGWGYTLFVPWA